MQHIPPSGDYADGYRDGIDHAIQALTDAGAPPHLIETVRSIPPGPTEPQPRSTNRAGLIMIGIIAWLLLVAALVGAIING